jgi:hypothetical protein
MPVVSHSIVSSIARWRALAPWLVAAALPLTAGACSKEAKPEAEAAPAPALGGVTSPASLNAQGDGTQGVAQARAAPRFSENSFHLEMKSKGDYRAGQPAAVEVVLEAKGPYKVNDKYPIKLKLSDATGVSYPSKVVAKDQVQLDPKRAVMNVSFTPERPGKTKIGGQFAFSVCTEERCLVEKRELALDVQVN